MTARVKSATKSDARPTITRPKRHREIRDSDRGLTDGAIKRIARRAGVKRIAKEIFPEARIVVKMFLERAVKNAITYTDYKKRKTVSVSDVLNGLRRQGQNLYGFEQ